MHARRRVNRLKRRRKRTMLTRSDKGMSRNINKRKGLGLVDEAELDMEAVLREATGTPTPPMVEEREDTLTPSQICTNFFTLKQLKSQLLTMGLWTDESATMAELTYG